MAPLAHRQVLDDPFLHVVKAGVVLVEYLPRAGDVVGVLGPLVPRDVEDGVEPGADPADFRRLVRGPLELVDLAQRGRLDRLRQVGLFDPGPVVVLLGALAVAAQLVELLADRGELLAEQEFLLLLLHALGHVLADGLRDVKLGQVVLDPADRGLKPAFHVGGLKQLQLLLGGQVTRVPGTVRDRRRVVELLDHVHDLPRAALLQRRDDQGLVLLGQLRCLRSQAGLLDDRALDPQRRAGTGRALADLHPGQGAQHRARLAAWQPADLLDDGERAGTREPAVPDPRHDEDLRLLLGTDSGSPPEALAIPSRVDRAADLVVCELDGDNHARQHHIVIERQHRQRERLAHQSLLKKVESPTLNLLEPGVVPRRLSAHSDQDLRPFTPASPCGRGVRRRSPPCSPRSGSA